MNSKTGPLVTRSKVFEACDVLEQTLDRWGHEEVRQRLGGGSYAQIGPLLKLWREQSELRNTYPAVPTVLLDDILVAVNQAFERDQDMNNEYLATMESLQDEAMSELTEALGRSEGEREHLNEQLCRASDEISLIRGDLDSRIGVIAELEQSLAVLQEKNAVLTEELRGMQRERDTAKEDAHEAHLEVLRRTENNSKEKLELHNLFAKEKAQLAKEADAARHAALNSLRHELASDHNRVLAEHREAASNERDALEGQLRDLDRKLAASQQAFSSVERENLAKTEQLNQLQSKQEEMQQRLLELTSRNERISGQYEVALQQLKDLQDKAVEKSPVQNDRNERKK